MNAITQTAKKAAKDESLISGDTSSPLLKFFCDENPETGTVTQLADGVLWLRMPLPMAGLDHINLYIIRDGDGWAVVDTGIGSRESKGIWKSAFEGAMGGLPVTKVICTHLHPDHTGLAGWICDKFGAPLIMTRGEYFLCRLMAADTGQPAPEHALEFYRMAGLTETQIELYKARFGGFGKAITPMPVGYQRIMDGQSLTLGGRQWEIIVGSGHSPEHACLFSPELNLCLTGDQLLPNISSNVSVWPTEFEGNPLQDWIDSCQKLKAALPAGVLVGPAHGIPFTGAHRRLDKLVLHHEKALERLLDYCDTPKRAVDVYPVLFRRKINDGNRIMAVGESLAHLNCLLARGLIRRRFNDAGQYTYQRRSA
ncbi:MBL fold metallo-hydrolase [Robiginitomaculum antarcticum]|uniref:MBL fold metallo-hydrolase n=1 Tax=Robiginitomaculum antarcticum TaxID=437507 RepID=UPI0003725031|nr:MBL fold metallo-hydrolase [Robiginitomaculum antarcticum]